MRPFLHTMTLIQSQKVQLIEYNVIQSEIKKNIHDVDIYTLSLIYHLLFFSLMGDDSKDIRPYKRPSDGFSLRLERTSSILTKASSSVFMIYLAGRTFVCIFLVKMTRKYYKIKRKTAENFIIKS